MRWLLRFIIKLIASPVFVFCNGLFQAVCYVAIFWDWLNEENITNYTYRQGLNRAVLDDAKKSFREYFTT